MNEPKWLKRAWVDQLHLRQLRRFGGQFGVRDSNAIESALARQVQKWHYAEERRPAALAAAYGYGLTRNHGYIDGNKRVGFVAMAAFLELNGLMLEADEGEVVRVVLSVAEGTFTEEALTAWIEAHLVPVIPEAAK